MSTLPLSGFRPDMIIWSADVPLEDLRKVIKAGILPKGTVIKLDRFFFEVHPKNIISEIQNEGYPVFVDAKIIEIPDKSIAIAETYLKYHPFMLNIMAGACSTGMTKSDNPKKLDTLKRFADICEEAGTKSCAVTVLTSKSPDLVLREFHQNPLDQVVEYVKLMHSAGITDIVCSPMETVEIRDHAEFDDMDINTPGVRLPDSSKDDQARIATPFDALNNGSTRLVIGRDLIRGEEDIVTRVGGNYDKILTNIFGEPYTKLCSIIGQ